MLRAWATSHGRRGSPLKDIHLKCIQIILRLDRLAHKIIEILELNVGVLGFKFQG
jgi:hypothetical protein